MILERIMLDERRQIILVVKLFGFSVILVGLAVKFSALVSFASGVFGGVHIINTGFS